VSIDIEEMNRAEAGKWSVQEDSVPSMLFWYRLIVLSLRSRMAVELKPTAQQYDAVSLSQYAPSEFTAEIPGWQTVAFVHQARTATISPGSIPHA
jgi:hypothetical protein